MAPLHFLGFSPLAESQRDFSASLGHLCFNLAFSMAPCLFSYYSIFYCSSQRYYSLLSNVSAGAHSLFSDHSPPY